MLIFRSDENRSNIQPQEAALQTLRVIKTLLVASRHARSYSPTALNSLRLKRLEAGQGSCQNFCSSVL